MTILFSKKRFALAAMFSALALSVNVAHATDIKVNLTGAEETPAVNTSAIGSGVITINADKTVSGSITTQGLTGTVAHIHLGAVGQKGPPVITLAKNGDNTWNVPAGSTLTDDQYASFKAGNLYLNVHSATNKGGEIRGQLNP